MIEPDLTRLSIELSHFAHSKSATCPTAAIALTGDIGIDRIVGMPTRAMAFRPFSESSHQSSNPTPDVLCIGHRLQMGWINTITNTAEMVEIEAIGDCAYQKLVGEAMGTDGMPASNSEIAIAIDLAAHPEPAGIGLINLRPKTLFKGKMDSHRVTSGVMGWDVQSVAIPSILS